MKILQTERRTNGKTTTDNQKGSIELSGEVKYEKYTDTTAINDGDGQISIRKAQVSLRISAHIY